MAFQLRTISFSAEGRRIVRTSRVEGDTLRVGRAAGSDIRLNDLDIALQHATIERIADGRIRIAGEGALEIEVDGRATRSTQLKAATGGIVRIGPFRLTLLPQEPGSDDVAIDVERASTGADEAKLDARRFALGTVMPSKRAIAWTFALVTLAVFLLWPVWYHYRQSGEERVASAEFHPDRLWLSGSLSPGHAGLRDNCSACHVRAFEPVSDASCQSCHTNIADHADHGRLARARPGLGTWDRIQLNVQEAFGQTPGRCVDCHTEHEGAQRMAPTPQRFCSDCHADLDSRLAGTRLGDAADFETLHPEFQPSVLIRWDDQRPVLQRVSLAARPRENSNLRFPHALHLEPRGGVAQMGRRLSASHGFGERLQCADCHVPTPDGVRFQPPDMEGDCQMCHSLAFEEIDGTVRTLRHGEPRQVVADIFAYYRAGLRQRPAGFASIRGRPGDVHRVRDSSQQQRAVAGAGMRADQLARAVFMPGGACADCHFVTPPSGRSAAFGIRPVAFPTRYMLHGWFDHRAHQIVQRPGQRRLEGSEACLSCHRADASNDAADLLIPNQASCRDCHGGETSRKPVESTCAMCHDFHMDEGVPAMLLRQQVRGRRWTTTVTRIEPLRGRNGRDGQGGPGGQSAPGAPAAAPGQSGGRRR